MSGLTENKLGIDKKKNQSLSNLLIKSTSSGMLHRSDNNEQKLENIKSFREKAQTGFNTNFQTNMNKITTINSSNPSLNTKYGPQHNFSPESVSKKSAKEKSTSIFCPKSVTNSKLTAIGSKESTEYVHSPGPRKTGLKKVNPAEKGPKPTWEFCMDNWNYQIDRTEKGKKQKIEKTISERMKTLDKAKAKYSKVIVSHREY
jgi:hypothetical protein